MLKIDPEIRDKIPPLSSDEFSRLEENILSDGEVREPLVVWNGTIVDGHHRWQIIQKHPEIPYKVKELDFADRWAAISWMCSNQLGRRNITYEQRAYLLGKLYEARKNTVGAADGFRGNQYTEVVSDQKGHLAKTRATVAKEQGVTEKAVQTGYQFAKGLDAADSAVPGFREDVLSGNVKVTKDAVQNLRKLSGEELKSAVEELKKPKSERKPKVMAEDIDAVASIESALLTNTAREYTYEDLEEEVTTMISDFAERLNRTVEIRKAIVDSNAATFIQLLNTVHDQIDDIERRI